MRIIIDMQDLQTSFYEEGGARQHTVELAKALALNSRGHEIILAFNGALPDITEAMRVEFDSILPQENIKAWQQFFDTTAINREVMLRKNIWRKGAGEILREGFLNSLKGDIILSTNLMEGLFNPSCTSAKLLPTNSLMCTMLHDTVPLMYPKRYLKDPVVRAWYKEKIGFIKRSDIILTSSRSTQLSINKYLKIPEKKIYFAYPGIDHEKFKPDDIKINERNNILSRMGISSNFVMYTLGSKLYNNINIICSAFSKLPRDILSSYQLVIVGGEYKGEEDHYANKLSALGIIDNVVFIGHVDNDDLAMLYNLCDLFISDSINEGFRNPMLEAMACGAVVLASNTSSHPEVVGCKDALFSPHDDLGLARKMELALTDSKFRDLLRENGIQQARKFSWEESAESLLIIFEEIIQNRDSIHTLPMEYDPINNIISHVASLDSRLYFDDKDLSALSSSIAETFYPKRRLFLDVSSLINIDHLTGIQRVVKAVCNELLNNPQEIDIELVYTTPNDLEFYRAKTLINKISGESRECVSNERIEFSPGDILLFIDLYPSLAISHKGKIQLLRYKGILVYHIVYDIIPVLMSGLFGADFFGADFYSEFHEWLLAIPNSDGAICISRSVADELTEWLKINGPKYLRPFKIGWFHLGADVENALPTRGLPDDAPQVLSQLTSRPSFLMVGTLEPRKGHVQTLAAFELLWADGVDINLVIVGRRGWMMEMLLENLLNHPERGKRLFWLESISDEYLKKAYAASTCLIAPSEAEGFGLPLIEAAQHKLPIIARDIPVFREVAGEHAFYFIGKEPADLVRAIRDWLALYHSNSHPKSNRMPWLTWKQSTQQLLDLILKEQWQWAISNKMKVAPKRSVMREPSLDSG